MFNSLSANCKYPILGLFSTDWKKLFVGKPDLKSFNVKGAEENFVLPGYDSKSRTETQVKIMGFI
jgi:hypothetical protein